MTYKSHVGFNILDNRKGLVILGGGTLIIATLIGVFFPFPASIFIIGFFGCFIVCIFLIGAVIAKFIGGVFVTADDERVHFYRIGTLYAAPGDNELIFRIGRGFFGKCTLTRKNILRARAVVQQDEIRKLRTQIPIQMSAYIKMGGASIAITPLNLSQEYLDNAVQMCGVSDLHKVVELTLRELLVRWPSGLGNNTKGNTTGTRDNTSLLGDQTWTIPNAKLFVSVKDPKEFVHTLTRK